MGFVSCRGFLFAMIGRMAAGKFIVFEGPDGSGQSTQANLLKEYLERKGQKVLLTKEPTKGEGSPASQKIGAVLHGEIKIEPAELQKLFVEDRKWHLHEVMSPALQRGTTVISDRYFFSTIAFGSLDCDIAWLIELNKDFLVPDITFLLIARPEICIERIGKRGEGFHFFEKLEKLKKVVETYKALATRFKNTHLIDAERTIEEIREEIRSKVDSLFV